MSAEKTIDDLLDELIQFKVTLRRLIEDCQEKVKAGDENYQVLFILRNKLEMLDIIHTEIHYLTADKVRKIMS